MSADLILLVRWRRRCILYEISAAKFFNQWQFRYVRWSVPIGQVEKKDLDEISAAKSFNQW